MSLHVCEYAQMNFKMCSLYHVTMASTLENSINHGEVCIPSCFRALSLGSVVSLIWVQGEAELGWWFYILKEASHLIMTRKQAAWTDGLLLPILFHLAPQFIGHSHPYLGWVFPCSCCLLWALGSGLGSMPIISENALTIIPRHVFY